MCRGMQLVVSNRLSLPKRGTQVEGRPARMAPQLALRPLVQGSRDFHG